MCTPDGRVLHAIAGEPGADTYLAQLQFGVELAGLPPDEVRARHKARAASNNWTWDLRSSLILQNRSLEPLADMEAHTFQELGGQTYDPDAQLEVQVLDDAAWEERLSMLPMG